MELATLLWTDVDLAEKTIVIPAAKYKTGKAHLVPLSRQSVALVESLPRLGPFVFTGRGEQAMRGFHTRKEKIDALIDPPIDYDLHDLRRTVRTGLARLRVAESTAERCLGHTARGIERHYNMHGYRDEKAQALQAWADHVTRIVSGEAAVGNVVTMVR
jgi:integrase